MNLHDIPAEKLAIKLSGKYYADTGLFWVICETRCAGCDRDVSHVPTSGQRFLFDHYLCAMTVGGWSNDGTWICDCRNCMEQDIGTEDYDEAHPYGTVTHYYSEGYNDRDPDEYRCNYCENGQCPTLPQELVNVLS